MRYQCRPPLGRIRRPSHLKYKKCKFWAGGRYLSRMLDDWEMIEAHCHRSQPFPRRTNVLPSGPFFSPLFSPYLSLPFDRFTKHVRARAIGRNYRPSDGGRLWIVAPSPVEGFIAGNLPENSVPSRGSDAPTSSNSSLRHFPLARERETRLRIYSRQEGKKIS